MLGLQPKTSIMLSDVITESVMIISALVLFVSVLVLYYAYRKRAWLLAVAGMGAFLVGSVLDLVDEFYRLPQVVPRVVENGLLAGGLLLFSFGLLVIVLQLANMAVTDPLTGLHNKRYLSEILEKAIARSRRYKVPLSVAFLDLNGFKKVNDSHGHTVGDVILREVAQTLKTAVRQSDFITRFGGDEFVVVMPDTDFDGGTTVIQRLKDVVSTQDLGIGFNPGISGGVAEFPRDGSTAEDLVNAACRRMYQEKSQRN